VGGRPLAVDAGLLNEAPAGPRWKAVNATQHRLWNWFFNGTRPEPLPSRPGLVERPEKGKLGICCSGGGIRSAAFSLGALQELQKRGELRRAAYLAAVSGGSYIAGAFSMVAKTGIGDSNAALLDAKEPFAPGSPEEQYLRNRCSYLAPTLTDKAYLAWRVLLGLIFNLAFVALPLVALTFVLCGALYAPRLPDLAGHCGRTCAASSPTWFWAAPVAVLVLSALFGWATLLIRWHNEAWERFFAIWATRLLFIAGVLGLILVGLPHLVEWFDSLAVHGQRAAEAKANTVKPPAGKTAAVVGGSFAALLAGVAAQLGHVLTSKEARKEMGQARKALSKLGSGARLALAYAAGALAGPLLLLAFVALALAFGMASATPHGGVEWEQVAIGAALLLVFGALYLFLDLTTWSLHPYYKRRPSSAFALKRIGYWQLSDEERERVEALPSAGGAEYIGIAIERDFDRMVQLSKTALSEQGSCEWPTLLICAAANISDPGATPPGRHVTSFTFSAHAAGGPLVGAVPMLTLERAFESEAEARQTEEVRPPGEQDADSALRAFRARHSARRKRRRDLTMPTAMAISGAAISPSMGKMTARPLTFLMALANLRLGVWIPNPRWVAHEDGAESLPKRYARPRPWYLLCELLGRNRVDSRYLYVTDGGHYENLGLVELLRRGCSDVYCFDASGIGQGRAEFEALGEAISLARSELEVEIEFPDADPAVLAPDEKTHMAKSDVVEGTISYPDGTRGRLLYVRNAMTAAAPWDAQAYQRADPRFPHNSTVDQLYTDQKFEAYRVLGARAGAKAVEMLRGHRARVRSWAWRC
jgi:hypothetical protein